MALNSNSLLQGLEVLFDYGCVKHSGMYSEALRILDRNTVRYMIEEQQKELEQKKEEIDHQKITIADQQKEIEELKRQLEQLIVNKL